MNKQQAIAAIRSGATMHVGKNNAHVCTGANPATDIHAIRFTTAEQLEEMFRMTSAFNGVRVYSA